MFNAQYLILNIFSTRTYEHYILCRFAKTHIRFLHIQTLPEETQVISDTVEIAVDPLRGCV